ncbi:MAG: DedA family protein [Thermogemmatispora sp.]|uniref:DedA family protein n=1 Tax=Thermogemmatispora sp. TaxID=1968838 RepID=UPI00261E68B1|nr:DedA family protein [Thermogemmatispora sp.]MBX5456928.1 DedA family protein [Thermogemmatispora sp.]
MFWWSRLVLVLVSVASRSVPFFGVIAALISLQTLQDVLHVWGYPAVALFIMIESSGIPFPGETMLLLASFLAGVDRQLQIPLVIACAALGAIVGDNLGYLLGRHGGRPLVERFGRYVFLKPEHLERAEQFFARHGDKTVFFGRFIAVLRAWAAFLAGVNRMRWRTFLVYNAAGGIVWATVFGLLGYFAGRVFHDNFAAVEHLARTISWTGALLLVVVGLVALLLYRLRRTRLARQRQPALAQPRQGEDSGESGAASVAIEQKERALAAVPRAESTSSPSAASAGTQPDAPPSGEEGKTSQQRREEEARVDHEDC